MATKNFKSVDQFIDHLFNLITEKARNGDLTTSEIAERVGVTQATISRYLNRKQRPTDPMIDKLCKLVGIAVEITVKD